MIVILISSGWVGGRGMSHDESEGQFMKVGQIVYSNASSLPLVGGVS